MHITFSNRHRGRGWLALLALCSGVLVLLWALAAPAPDPPEAPQSGRDAREAQRSASAGRHSATLEWKFRSTGPGSDFTTATLGADGTVYAGCGSNLVALDAAGRERWCLALQGSVGRPLLSGEDTLYVTGGHDELYGVSTDGVLLWSYAVPGGVRGAVQLTPGGEIVVAGYDNVLRLLSAQGAERWMYSAGDHSIEAGPVLDASGSIYITVYGTGICELSATGILQQTYPLADTAASELKLYPDGSFMVRDYSAIYKMQRDGRQAWSWDLADKYIPADMALRNDGMLYYGDSDGVVHCLSGQGRELWRYKSGTRSVASPVLGPDGAVAVLDDAATLTVLDLNGAPRYAKKLAESAWFGTPACFSQEGTLYASGGGYLYALGLDGSELWKYSGGGGFAATPLLAADGTVYAACMDGNLYALRPDGALRWQLQLSGLSMYSPALAADGTLLVPAGTKLYAVAPGGSRLWEYDAGSPLSSHPALAPGGVICIGAQDGRLLALKPGGVLAWEYQTAGAVTGSGPAVGPDGRIYLGTGLKLGQLNMSQTDAESIASQQDGQLYALNLDGTLAWAFATGASIWSSPGFAPDGTVYIASTLGLTVMGGAEEEGVPPPSGKLFALTPQGAEKWSYPLLETAQGTPVVGADGTVYVSSWGRGFSSGVAEGGQLYALSPEGNLLWQGPYGCISTPVIGEDGTVYSSGLDYKLYALSPAGEVLWSYQLGQLVAGSPVIAPDGTLYVGCSNGYLYAIRDL